MFVTFDEIVIFFKSSQDLNADWPILKTESGISTVTKCLHSMKALSPIFSTPSGILTLFKFAQY